MVLLAVLNSSNLLAMGDGLRGSRTLGLLIRSSREGCKGCRAKRDPPTNNLLTCVRSKEGRHNPYCCRNTKNMIGSCENHSVKWGGQRSPHPELQ
ncbi:unnamed protein product [Allacma fusca]|uniref:Uncharacterized protein n=1 Tax=Allacma fusca TaxID=39272 RepID=A0A8J2KIQ9_9HEXA|nr:unnamed protein product [Allacma fusca]